MGHQFELDRRGEFADIHAVSRVKPHQMRSARMYFPILPQGKDDAFLLGLSDEESQWAVRAGVNVRRNEFTFQAINSDGLAPTAAENANKTVTYVCLADRSATLETSHYTRDYNVRVQGRKK